MSNDNKVVVVKVHRNAAGSSVPFDKLYFFPKAQTERIPSLFGYALVLPCEKELMAEVVKLRPKVLNAYRHRRDDSMLNQKLDVDARKQDAKEIADWWDKNILEPYALADRVIVVPILTSKIRKKINPRYMAAPRWFDKAVTPTGRSKRARRSLKIASPRTAISDFAYLATPLEAPHDKISPICNICPRQLLFLQGQCMPGQSICLKSLNFNEIGKNKERPAEEENPTSEDELEEAAMAADSDDEDN